MSRQKQTPKPYTRFQTIMFNIACIATAIMLLLIIVASIYNSVTGGGSR